MDEAYVRHVQELLHACGFGANTGPIDGIYGQLTWQAVGEFQSAWTYTDLREDGDAGPLTLGALEDCAYDDGHISPHFQAVEFASPDTQEVRFVRGLVAGLEALRSLDGLPLPILSGYRSDAHNQAVGGASSSMHLYGAAADIAGRGRFTLDNVLPLRKFSGIGRAGDDGAILHVDVRAEEALATGRPGVGATPDDPALWTY